MLSAILFVLRTGLPWRDLPERYGPWSSVYARYRRWCASGLFARMLAVLAKDAEGELRHLDCSHIKLHQHGANPPGGQAAQAMGRTKGGLNTKLSAVVDARGRAVALSLAPGPQHDQHAVVPVLPSARGRRIVADKGFDADVFRARLRTQRTRCCIPPKRGSPATGPLPSGLLPVPPSGRKLLRPDQNPSPHLHPLRQTGRDLPRLRFPRGDP